MFQPFDGALLASGTVLSASYGMISGHSPVLATVAGAAVTGFFVLVAKGVELWWKARTDRRVAELENQLAYAQGLRDLAKAEAQQPR